MVRPSATTSNSNRHPVSLSVSNGFDTHYNVDVDRRENIEDISATALNRRDALARFAATAVASATFLGGKAAFAADATEFSESPTSEASLARMAYDGKTVPAKEEPSKPAEEVETPKAEVKKPSEDFDGNEAGAVGASDEGSQPPPTPKKAVSAASVKNSLPILQLPYAYDDPKVVGGAAAAVTILGLAVLGTNNESEEEAATSTPVAKSAPPAEPYGLSGGRNYWDGVDMTAAKNAGLVANKAPPPTAPEPAAPVAPAVEVEQKEKPKWQLDQPVPYGIQNKDGKNPFIKQVQEYCVGGKVTEDCAKTIKGYLDDLADTGAVATSGEVKAIVGYLDSLGSNNPTPETKKAGAAFTSYLDALSEGSAPPPSSAKAVKTYLDTLVDTVSSAAKSTQREPMASPIVKAAPKEPAPAVVPEPVVPTPDFSQYDVRLTNIEGRVDSLETKVDQLPDKVFEKIEAWQTQQESRLGDEVKKIVQTLTPPPAPPAPEPVAAPVSEPVAVVPEPLVSIPEPEPAPIVSATPLVGALPPRGMPQSGDSAGGPKKGYGFGGGAAWKTSTTVAASVPEPVAAVPEPVVSIPEPEPAPIVSATPLAGAVPPRPNMPQPGDSAGGPKKSYGFGGGAAWKNMSP